MGQALGRKGPESNKAVTGVRRGSPRKELVPATGRCVRPASAGGGGVSGVAGEPNCQTALDQISDARVVFTRDRRLEEWKQQKKEGKTSRRLGDDWGKVRKRATTGQDNTSSRSLKTTLIMEERERREGRGGITKAAQWEQKKTRKLNNQRDGVKKRQRSHLEPKRVSKLPISWGSKVGGGKRPNNPRKKSPLVSGGSLKKTEANDSGRA